MVQSRERWPISPPERKLIVDQSNDLTTEQSLTVVALLALVAVTSHVTEAAARVASLLATTAEPVATAETTLGAVAGNVTDAAALVALLTTAAAVTIAALGAVTGDVTNATAAVAGLFLGSRGTFAA